jgi:hypothetical protein
MPTHEGFGGYTQSSSLLENALQNDAEKTIGWLRKLPAGQERDRLLSGAIDGAGSSLAQEIFAQLPSDWQQKTVQSVVWKIAEEDLDESLRWVQRLPPGVARSEGIVGVVSTTAQRFPAQTEAIIEQFHPGPDREAALRAYAASLSNRKPIEALEIAAKITTPAASQEAFRSIGSSWSYIDYAAATKWISTTPELTPKPKRYCCAQASERLQEPGRY